MGCGVPGSPPLYSAEKVTSANSGLRWYFFLVGFFFFPVLYSFPCGKEYKWIICFDILKKKKGGKKVLLYYSLVEIWQPPLTEAQTAFRA